MAYRYTALHGFFVVTLFITLGLYQAYICSKSKQLPKSLLIFIFLTELSLLRVLTTSASVGVSHVRGADCAAYTSNCPLRTRHCSQCNACIARRSHHCGVLGVCIGLYNHKYFLQLLLHAAICCGIVLKISIPCAFSSMKFTRFAAVQMLFSGLLALVLMLAAHLALLALNMTLAEARAGALVAAITRRVPVGTTAYEHHSVLRNFAVVCGSRLPLMWLLPFAAPMRSRLHEASAEVLSGDGVGVVEREEEQAVDGDGEGQRDYLNVSKSTGADGGDDAAV